MSTITAEKVNRLHHRRTTEIEEHAPQDTPHCYAGFVQRVAAKIIDGVILLPVGWLVDSLISNQGMTLILTTIVMWPYYAGMESSSWQATIGKRLLGIYVTDMKDQRLDFSRATVRWFAQILSGITLAIGYLMVAFTERKQGLHDMIAGTLVQQR